MQWQQALGLFVLRNVSLPPDIITYSAAISACEKNQMWQQAFGLLTETSDTIPRSALVKRLDHGSARYDFLWICSTLISSRCHQLQFHAQRL